MKDSLRADIQNTGNLIDRLAVCQQAENLKFPLGQILELLTIL